MNSVITILANVFPICSPRDAISQQEKDLYSALEREYNNTCNDPNVYATGFESITWGRTNPDTIKALAERWNPIIHDRLNRAIGQYLLKDKMDGPETYELVKAAMAANDEMHCYARELLFNMVTEQDTEDTDWTLSSILKPHQLQHIIDHPGNYAICELVVK